LPVASVSPPGFRVDLPPLSRCLHHPSQPLPLLLLRDVEPELHEHLAVVGQPALELVDLVVGGAPDALLHEPLDPLDQHPAVPGVVEDRHLTVLGQPHLVTPQPVIAPLQVRGGRALVGAEGARIEPLHQPADGGGLAGGVPARAQVDGHLQAVPFAGIEKLVPYHTELIAMRLLASKRDAADKLVRTGSTDISYSLARRTRFRVNIFQQRGTYSIVLRVIPNKIPTVEELNIPPQLNEIAT